MSADQPAEQDPGHDPGRRARRKKAGNSDKFNELLSEANKLSVNERVRLVKSLAGQHGLTVFTQNGLKNLLVQSTSGGKDSGHPKQNSNGVQPGQTENPLRRSAQQKALDVAKAKVKEEKVKRGVTMLPPSDPVMVEYNQALNAYRALREITTGKVSTEPTNGGVEPDTKRSKQNPPSPEPTSGQQSGGRSSNGTSVGAALTSMAQSAKQVVSRKAKKTGSENPTTTTTQNTNNVSGEDVDMQHL